ncbi:unnamed protein product [Moneuplotes crassus]|uniref:Uncharacterized protein n=1 Tax=Euplotes crassus TaxID=5936 RepID=A0AAD1UH61_EUPCR|nr:unnamed protein product [Moneuplotes crassus]
MEDKFIERPLRKNYDSIEVLESIKAIADEISMIADKEDDDIFFQELPSHPLKPKLNTHKESSQFYSIIDQNTLETASPDVPRKIIQKKQKKLKKSFKYEIPARKSKKVEKGPQTPSELKYAQFCDSGKVYDRLFSDSMRLDKVMMNKSNYYKEQEDQEIKDKPEIYCNPEYEDRAFRNLYKMTHLRQERLKEWEKERLAKEKEKEEQELKEMEKYQIKGKISVGKFNQKYEQHIKRYQNKIQENTEIREQNEVGDHTFKPKIKKYKVKGSKTTRVKRKNYWKNECTFKPQINKKMKATSRNKSKKMKGVTQIEMKKTEDYLPKEILLAFQSRSKDSSSFTQNESRINLDISNSPHSKDPLPPAATDPLTSDPSKPTSGPLEAFEPSPDFKRTNTVEPSNFPLNEDIQVTPPKSP